MMREGEVGWGVNWVNKQSGKIMIGWSGGNIYGGMCIHVCMCACVLICVYMYIHVYNNVYTWYIEDMLIWLRDGKVCVGERDRRGYYYKKWLWIDLI